jgi:hypothetical protein
MANAILSTIEINSLNSSTTTTTILIIIIIIIIIIGQTIADLLVSANKTSKI